MFSFTKETLQSHSLLNEQVNINIYRHYGLYYHTELGHVKDEAHQLHRTKKLKFSLYQVIKLYEPFHLRSILSSHGQNEMENPSIYENEEIETFNLQVSDRSLLIQEYLRFPKSHVHICS